ncbi:MAG: 2-phospho-L-lactate transferase, partial [Candidatus Limnocylindrales bacterium]
LRGPADRMMAGLGEDSTALGVARRYASQELLDGFFIDREDGALANPVRALGLEVVVTDTIMTSVSSRARLGREMLDAAAALRAGRSLHAQPEERRP